MTQQQPKDQSAADDEIDLRELFRVFWKGKWIILATTFIFAVGSVIYALSLPNIYAAEAKLAPTEEAQGQGVLGDMGGQLGGFASMAGLNMGQTQITPAIIAREMLLSRKFISEFINKHNVGPELLAVEEWDERSGELILDREIYDPNTDEWLRDDKPTNWELVEVFKEKLTVEQETGSTLTTIRLEHLSPIVAKQWVDWLVEDINNRMRERDIEESRRSLEYIDREMANTTLRSTQQIFSGLMEQHTQTIMLANVRPEYIYRVVDPAVIPEDRASPSRSLIVILASFIGGFISLLIVLIINVIKKDR